MLAPSGEQVEIALGEQRAVVVEVGGGLRSYRVGDLEVLDGYGRDELCTSARGQVLLPWPNRLAGGSYEYEGRQHQLPLDEPATGNAIHGLVRWANWTVAERGPSRVQMAHTLHPRPGYPFSLELSVEYSLASTGLSVRTTATNAGAGPCPFGAGAHPYLTVGTATVDPIVLRVPARTVLESDANGIPTGRGPVDGTEHDFRSARPLATTRLDHAFADLERDEDGFARVGLRRPDGGSGITLWVDESYRYLMLFTGDPLPDVARRSLAVEPMTCPPNAFRSKEDLIALDPGDSFVGTWGLEPG